MKTTNPAPPGARRNPSRLAALAASVSFAAIASPAFAQCVEGPPANFTCSGQTDVSQVIVSDDAIVTADLAFEVDTSGNGIGLALDVSGDGPISFTGGSSFTGSGVRFATTGSSGLSGGELSISSNAGIFANGSRGLRLENSGGGDTVATWLGTIINTGGDGVFAGSDFGAGDLGLTVKDVGGLGDGINVDYGANGSVVVAALGTVLGQTGAGVRIDAGAASDDVDLTVGDVFGGSWGIVIDSQGTDLIKVDAAGIVSGISESGIAVLAGAKTTGVEIRANQVSGAVSGIQAENQGINDTVIAATGPVIAQGNGILAVNGTAAHDISISAGNVSGFYGIRTFNEGIGATSITTTGLVTGGDFGIIAQNVGGSTDLVIQAADISADGFGIQAENSGSGTTTVVAGNVTGQDDVGVRIVTEGAAGSVDLTVGDATGGQVGIVVDNSGAGAARVTATGTVTGVGDIGMNVLNDTAATDIEIHVNNVNGGFYSGILALNQGTGDTLIEATGLVAAPAIYGIAAVNEATARNLSVSTVDVIGGRGLSISNFGTGTTDVISTGTVTGYAQDGIVVGNLANATDLLVDVNIVNGEDRGMRILNQGTGATSIRAHGTVTGTTGNGVHAEIGATGLDLNVEVVDVTGVSGIVIDNQGVGTTRVAATGTVTGTSGAGINVLAYTLTDDVEIDVADVTGGTGGVIVTNYGTGSASITASGTVSALAADGFGIAAETGTGSTDIRIAAADVLGNAGGIYTRNLGSGETAITSTGTVTGGFSFGIFARNDAGATDLTIEANTVLGAEDGIATEHVGTGATRIVAAAATGTSGAGVRVQAEGTAGAVDVAVGDASGGDYGVLVSNFGTDTTRVETTGLVSGVGDGGIAIENGGATTGIDLRAAQASGATYGIAVQNSGTGNTSVVATGLVTGAGDGMIVRNDAAASDLLLDVAAVQGGSTGIFAINQGIGRTSVRSSDAVVGGNLAGIDVRADVAALDVTIDTATVTGGNGITVQNFGQGSASVTASGTVAGSDATGTGIGVVNGTGSTDLSVAAVGAGGGFRGIGTVNNGSGATLIAATGLVSGGDAGIFAENGLGATDLTIRAVEVAGGSDGISAENLGSGRTVVVADGTVKGAAESGIRVRVGANAGDLTIESGTVSGGMIGIGAQNDGLGAALVTSSGLVTGSYFGIYARTEFTSTDLTIRAAEVESGAYGIAATNLGTGSTTIVATGAVEGAKQAGISVGGGANSGDLTVLAASVTGGLVGLRIDNEGVGATAVRTAGLVTGGDFGILAENDASTTDLTIRVTDVQSAGTGVFAENLGTGATSLVSTGTVVAQDQTGLRVVAGAGAGDITVEAANVSGGMSGISVADFGLGDIRITANGVVQGGTRGIEAFADGNQRVVIVNNGTVRNASALGSARAISASGGTVGIGNAATLLGTVEIAGDTSLLLNSGSWQSIGGTSSFATMDDTVLNATTGTVTGGLSAAAAEVTTWQGLERFQNNGVLRLQDGGIGDMIQTSAATTFAGGSALSVDIAGVNGADTYHTTGKAVIEPGARLQAATTQPLVLHGKYVVVQADGGLSGQFLFEDQLVTAFAGLRDNYTATSAFLEFAQMKALDSAALTPNQKAAAGGADSLPDGNAVKDALLLLPDAAAAQDAFDQLSGEIHPSARNAMVEDSRLVRSAVIDRLVDGDPGTGVWGRLFATSGTSDGDYNAARLDRDTKGGVIGVDHRFGPVTIGVAGGRTDTDLRIGRRASNGSIQGIRGMAYAGARLGGFGLRGGVGYARTATETVRRIAYPGFSATPTADYHGSVVQGFVETGYRLPVGGGQIEPFAGLTAIGARTHAFTETGGPAALSGAAVRETTTSSTLGTRFETSPAGALSLRGTVGWRHSWGDLDPVGRHTFAGGAPFTVLGTAGSTDAGVFDAEARYRLSPNVTLSVGYNGILGARNADHAITGAFRIVF